MTIPDQRPTGQICTFYSYKGGVGRSMALANVAVLMAQWGRRVLAVDWDLEAPGLGRYFEDLAPDRAYQIDDNDGVIEIAKAVSEDRQPDWQACVSTLAVPKARGTLDFIAAGRSGNDYARRLQQLDWDELFRQHDFGARLEAIRSHWLRAYDHVLIDSRTGITDIGGICTIYLPDVLVALFTANRQSVEGIADVLGRVRRARPGLPVDRRALLCVPVPARDESRTEYEQSMEWRRRYEELFGSFYLDFLPREVTAVDALDLLRIPNVPYWSFGERLPVLTESPSDPSGITYYYALLARLLATELSWQDSAPPYASSFDEPPPSKLAARQPADWLASEREGRLGDQPLDTGSRWPAASGRSPRRAGVLDDSDQLELAELATASLGRQSDDAFQAERSARLSRSRPASRRRPAVIAAAVAMAVAAAVATGLALALGSRPGPAPAARPSVRIYDVSGPPAAIALDGSRAWVAETSGQLVGLNARNGELVSTETPGLRDPADIAAGGGNVWIANLGTSRPNSGFVIRIAESTGKTTKISSASGVPIPNPTAIAIQGDQVWVANLGTCTKTVCSGFGSVTYLDAGTGTLIGTIPGARSGITYPGALAVSGPYVWVLDSGYNGGLGGVTRIDSRNGATLTLTSASYGFERPSSIAVSGGRVWVLNTPYRGGFSVTELNASNGSFIRTVSGPQYDFGQHVSADAYRPEGIAADGDRVWVVDPNGGTSGNGAITEINAKTGGLIRVLSGSLYLFSTPDAVVAVGSQVWIANSGGASVTVLRSFR